MAEISPLKHISLPKHDLQGKVAISQGKIGTIVLAGGHGSRLDFTLPKGLFPISAVAHKSLFQLLAEKVLGASIAYGCDLMLAIMTSSDTHEKTIEHFENAGYFGLKKSQVSFFQQQNLPVLNDEGQPLKEIQAPCGNGALFWDFARSGLLDAWQKEGIEHVTCFTIDNALADPFQPHLIGQHVLHHNDSTVVGIARIVALEPVGLLVEKGGKIAVIEYSEMAESEREEKDANGIFKHPLANISYFAFSLDFMRRVANHPLNTLALHKAKKKIKDAYYIKCEYFIFDALEYSEKTEVLLLSREDYFAPLKNQTGHESPTTCKALLEARDRRTYHAITGKWPESTRPFELKPAIYYQNWHNIQDRIEEFIEHEEA